MTSETFCRALEADCGVAPGAHVLAAVSGGADSVALLCLLDEARGAMGIRVSCAHVEHGIRGQASLEDMAFVRDLCKQKKIDFYVQRVDAPAQARSLGCGVEAAARVLRYAFLEETRARIGADVIACAHHSGDQAETVLMRAARGSDLRGLCAMRMRRGVLIRPLLRTSPAQLRAYLARIGQPWREDATNEDERHARNRIRRCVLPELERAYAGAGEALCRLSLAAQRDEDFFVSQLDALGVVPVMLADGAAIGLDALRAQHDALLSRAVVRAIEAAGAQAGAPAVETLIGAIRTGRETAVELGVFGGALVQARVGTRFLCVTRPRMAIGDVPLAPEGETLTPMGRFSVREAKKGETGDGVRSQVVPAGLLQGARVTARREGDAMIPFGQHTPVKVKKLMIDAGVERAMRRSIPVVRNEDGIFWLAGLRPGEACRAGAQEARRMITFDGAPAGALSDSDHSVKTTFQEDTGR